ncbi:LysR family transcriptional regulator [Devosia limi DSM 17137]|uniref:LysR family transcriptional regulator n=1 Tax=Devosia limi DSM 17137 TaxID=1121477 RepID=A0A0F5LTN9_9HYPH|nr:LysR family transcriptional regulator [Devosia limi]KKB85708.1 LysR family transcriptional regulator [Devosia limi DSM 17137]SHF97362.1 LysR family transcriptional regulator, glycine cleavage system transcriptional activator [Devosia limi DSM 17137]
MTKLPPLKALQAFEAFGRLRSVTGVASELGVTPGAVSQQLKKAEEAVGLRLLERHGKNIELTTSGRLYHREISRGFDTLRGAQETLARIKAQSALVLSCLPSLANKFVGPRLFDWQTSHEGANVRLIGTGTEPRLGDDSIDFRVSYGDRIRQFENYVELFTDWVVPACSPAFIVRHPVAKPVEILEQPLLGIEWDSDHKAAPSWQDWAKSVGAKNSPQGEFAFSLSSSAIDAAINGRGFVLAQLAMIEDDLAAGRLVVPFDHRLKLAQAYFLAWDRAALSKPFGNELRTWIISISKSQKATLGGPNVQ